MPLSTIGSNQITDGAIAVADVADGSITTAKIADNAVTTAKITDANITTAKIADDAVTSAKTDVTTLGTVEASKAVTADANGDVLFPTNSRLTLKTNSAQNPAVVIEGTGPNELLFAGDSSASTIANKRVDGVSLLYRTTPNDLEVIRSETNGLLAKFSNGNASANPATTPRVELYHNNNIKLETTSNGVKITGGIDFSANANASGMTSELLDDYEEGEFTPAYSPANGAFGGSYLTQKGRYTKIGRQVHVELQLVANFSNGTQSGNVQVSGLPFTATAHSSNGSFHALQIAQSTRFSGSAPKAGQIGVNDTKIFLFTNLGVTGGGSDQTQLTTSNFILSGGNPNNLVASITYFAD